MNKTVYEEGMEKGEVKAPRRLLRNQLQDRFGPLNETVQARLAEMPVERLEVIGLALLKSTSLKDLGLSD